MRFAVRLSYMLFAVSTLTLLGPRLQASCSSAKAVQGEIDLRNWDFDQCPLVSLRGQSYFFWMENLSLAEILDRVDQGHPDTTEVPSLWNSGDFSRHLLDSHGFATYYLRVLLPEEYPEMMGIYLWENPSAMTFAVNNLSEAKLGQISNIQSEEQANRDPVKLIFQPDSNVLHLHWQISSFSLGWGGMWQAPVLGDITALGNHISLLKVMEALGVGAILFLGMYYLLLWNFQRDQISYLYFGLFGTLTFIRALFAGSERLYHYIYPVPFEWSYRIEFLAFALMHWSLARFLHTLFHQVFPRSFLLLVNFCAVFFCSLVLTTDPAIFSSFVGVYQALWVLLILVFAVNVWKKMRSRIDSADVLFLVACVFPFIAGLHDILLIHMGMFSIPLFTHGLAVAMLMHTSVLSRRFTQTFANLKNEQQANLELSKRLSLQNQALVKEKAYRDLYLNIFGDKVRLLTDRLWSTLSEDDIEQRQVAKAIQIYHQEMIMMSGVSSFDREAQKFKGQDILDACVLNIEMVKHEKFVPAISISTEQHDQHFVGNALLWQGALNAVLLGIRQGIPDAPPECSIFLELNHNRLVMEVAIRSLHFSETRLKQLQVDASADEELKLLAVADRLTLALLLARRMAGQANGDFRMRDDKKGGTVFYLSGQLKAVAA